jgi:hypothetical protein
MHAVDATLKGWSNWSKEFLKSNESRVLMRVLIGQDLAQQCLKARAQLSAQSGSSGQGI